MSESRFVPDRLRSSTPRIELWDRRQRLTPTLAGYALRPGNSYRIRVSVPGRATSDWKLSRDNPPAVLNQFEAGDSDDTTHELSFHAPLWPENFWKGLAAGNANLDLIVSFPGTDLPSERLTVPMHLRPSPLGLFLVLLPVLLHLTGRLDGLSHQIVVAAGSAWEVSWSEWWVTGALCGSAWLFLTAAYLWWKKRFQPARRVARLRNQMQELLRPHGP
jgi:hypothetical protein